MMGKLLSVNIGHMDVTFMPSMPQQIQSYEIKYKIYKLMPSLTKVWQAKILKVRILACQISLG